jgi:hypothetical protein
MGAVKGTSTVTSHYQAITTLRQSRLGRLGCAVAIHSVQDSESDATVCGYEYRLFNKFNIQSKPCQEWF